jgi:hypothetical protein
VLAGGDFLTVGNANGPNLIRLNNNIGSPWLHPSSIAVAYSGLAAIQFGAPIAGRYFLHVAENLTNWFPSGTNRFPSGPAWFKENRVSPQSGCFYRVSLLQP